MARTEESGKAADLGCGMDFALEWRLDMIKRTEKHNPISGNRIDNPLDECQGNARILAMFGNMETSQPLATSRLLWSTAHWETEKAFQPGNPQDHRCIMCALLTHREYA